MASSDTAGLIRTKDGDINQYTADIHKDINSIKGMMTIDKSNGLSGLSVSSNDFLGTDGLINPDANYFDIYYDTEGKPYFLFNQYNPLFTDYLSRNGKKAGDNACSYCSASNAFIMAFGVHSVVDSFGIYMYTLDQGRSGKSGGVITGSNWMKTLSGDDPVNGGSSFYPFLEKYINGDNGNPTYQVVESTTVKNRVLAAIEAGEPEAAFAFKGGYAVKEDRRLLQQMIDEAEAAGYTVELNGSGVNAGEFGGNHYIAIHYDTEGGVKVMDSFGNRVSKEDKENGVGLMWTGGKPKDYQSNKIFKDGTTRETSIVFDTHHKGPGALEDFLKADNAGGGGEPVYIRITKK